MCSNINLQLKFWKKHFFHNSNFCLFCHSSCLKRPRDLYEASTGIVYRMGPQNSLKIFQDDEVSCSRHILSFTAESLGGDEIRGPSPNFVTRTNIVKWGPRCWQMPSKASPTSRPRV